MRILIAEDNVTMASALKYILQHMGYQHISEANDGGEALRLLSKNQFDLVIIDWSLPSVSGVAITRWMRLKDTYRETPIIMVTTKDQPEDVLIAVESGVNEYVLKPLDKDILKTKINKAMGKRHMPT
jgi:two-component system chemotaxis response regulator CheY